MCGKCVNFLNDLSKQQLSSDDVLISSHKCMLQVPVKDHVQGFVRSVGTAELSLSHVPPRVMHTNDSTSNKDSSHQGELT